MAQLVTISMATFNPPTKRRTKGRGYSADTLEAIKIVKSLRRNQARAWVVEPEKGDSVSKLRTRLARAAKACSVKLQFKIGDDRVLFTLRKKSSARPTATNILTATEKHQLIKVARNLKREFASRDLADALKGVVDLSRFKSVETMLGAVLRNNGFTRVGAKTYKRA